MPRDAKCAGAGAAAGEALGGDFENKSGTIPPAQQDFFAVIRRAVWLREEVAAFAVELGAELAPEHPE